MLWTGDVVGSVRTEPLPVPVLVLVPILVLIPVLVWVPVRVRVLVSCLTDDFLVNPETGIEEGVCSLVAIIFSSTCHPKHSLNEGLMKFRWMSEIQMFLCAVVMKEETSHGDKNWPWSCFSFLNLNKNFLFMYNHILRDRQGSLSLKHVYFCCKVGQCNLWVYGDCAFL